MKSTIVGMVVLMLMAAPVLAATPITKTELIEINASGGVLSGNHRCVDNQPILFEWGVDQQQTKTCGHGIILTQPWIYAQSFIPTKEKLTAVRLLIFKYGAPPEAVHITVCIRDNLTQQDLAIKTIDTSVVTIGDEAKWVLFDFDDIVTTPGNTYYIVCSGDAGDQTNAYCWVYDNEDSYPGGEAWIKPDDESVWSNFTYGGFNPQDFCFKTYFRRPFKSFDQKNSEVRVSVFFTRSMVLFWEYVFERLGQMERK